MLTARKLVANCTNELCICGLFGKPSFGQERDRPVFRSLSAEITYSTFHAGGFRGELFRGLAVQLRHTAPQSFGSSDTGSTDICKVSKALQPSRKARFFEKYLYLRKDSVVISDTHYYPFAHDPDRTWHSKGRRSTCAPEAPMY